MLSFLVLLTDKKSLFPPKKGHFLFIFQCLPLFLFSLFCASPLSSLSVSLSPLVLFFLPSCFSFSLSGSCFFFLLCLLFWFQDVLLFLFFCLLSCVVLNHNISFLFALHLVFFVVVVVVVCLACFVFWYFFILGNRSKTSLKNMETPKTAKIKNAEKTDILTRTVSTIVFTNSVFFVFCVSFNFACLLKTL